MDFQVTPLGQNPPEKTPPSPPSAPPPVPVHQWRPSTPPGPQAPGPRTFSSNTVLKWLIIVALALLVVSIAMLWFGGPSFREGDVVLKLEGPTQALSGDEATYTITYENHTKLELRDLSFRFFYPTGSIVVRDGSVSGDSSEGFTVETLSSGESGNRQVSLFLVGDKGNIKDAKVTMIFQAGSLRSSFEKSTAVSTTIVNLPVTLTLVAPPTAVSGQPLSYIIDYRNESGADINDLKLKVGYPDGFAFQRATPVPTTGNNTWDIPLLRRGAGARITVTGVLSGNERDAKNITVTLQRKINDQFIDYERAESSTVISSPLLNVSLAVNDSSAYTAVPGDLLRYGVSYANSSPYTLLGLTMTVKLDGDMYDFASLDPGQGSFDSGSGVITFNASGVPAFASLAPSVSGRLQFQVRLKPSFSSGMLGSKNFFVQATAKLSTPNVPSGIDGSEVFTQSSLATKITTQPTLTRAAYWNDPAFGSSGPLPMQVGQETTFTIHWILTNPGNDVSGAKIVSTLPPGVTWKNIVSAGQGQNQPAFNANSSQVTWDLGVLPQGIGVGLPKYEASFQVSVKPSVNQKGQSVVLMKSTSFSGTDSFTRQSIVVPVADVNSQDLIDRPGEGTVQ